jgi:hypothetical protein
MHFHTDEEPGRKSLDYAGSAYTLDLVARGGMAAPARWLYIPTGGTGSVWLRYKDDWSEETKVLTALEEPLSGYIAEIAFGNPAVYTGGAGSYPVVLTGAESLTLNFDDSTDHASGDIVITPPAGSYDQATLLAYINAAINAVIPAPGGHSQALAADAGAGASSLTSRSRGTGASVDVKAIHATLATGLGWATGVTNGTAFASPATLVRVTW